MQDEALTRREEAVEASSCACSHQWVQAGGMSVTWPGLGFPSVACHTLALSSCTAGCLYRINALVSSSWHTCTHCSQLCFPRYCRIDTAQSSVLPQPSTRKLAVPDYIAIVPASVANSTALAQNALNYVSVHPLACPPRWPQPDVGDWTRTNKQAVKRKPARFTCPGRGTGAFSVHVPCQRAVRSPPPEPPVVLFAVGSLLLALFVLSAVRSGRAVSNTISTLLPFFSFSCVAVHG